MAPLPTILDVYRVALNWTCGGQNAVNVMHFHVAGGTTPSALIAHLDTAASVSMWNSTIAAATVLDLQVTPLDGTTATQTFAPPTPGHWQGGGGGTEWSPATAAVIKMITAVRGRSYRGRLFLPFTAENEMVNGFVRSLILPGMQTAWTNFVTSLNALTPAVSLTVASYKLSVATNVLLAGPEPTLATQRRRQTRLR